MAESTPISFRSTSLADRLSKKGNSVGLQAQKELERYFNLLDWALPTLELNQQECLLICDTLNGVMFQGFEVSPNRALQFQLQDAIQYSKLDQKWEVDTEEFMRKISCFSPVQAASVMDAVEVFWNTGDYSKAEEDMNESVSSAFKLKATDRGEK